MTSCLSCTTTADVLCADPKWYAMINDILRKKTHCRMSKSRNARYKHGLCKHLQSCCFWEWGDQLVDQGQLDASHRHLHHFKSYQVRQHWQRLGNSWCLKRHPD